MKFEYITKVGNCYEPVPGAPTHLVIDELCTAMRPNADQCAFSIVVRLSGEPIIIRAGSHPSDVMEKYILTLEVARLRKGLKK
jgi:hypothetical protein